MKAIDRGNITVIILFLNTQGKSRGYSERPEHDVNSGERPVEFTLKLGDRVVKEA